MNHDVLRDFSALKAAKPCTCNSAYTVALSCEESSRTGDCVLFSSKHPAKTESKC